MRCTQIRFQLLFLSSCIHNIVIVFFFLNMALLATRTWRRMWTNWNDAKSYSMPLMMNHVWAAPTLLILKLTPLFQGTEDRSDHSSKSAELRIKLGEALVKATRMCGELLPRYSQVIVAALLSGAKDPDHLVRASSLSSLGEVCKLLRFSLGPVLHEVSRRRGCVCLATNERLLRPGQTVLPTQVNSSQVHNFDGVGYRLAIHFAWVGSSWIELAWIWASTLKFAPNSSQVSHRLANSRQVVLLLLCDYAIVFRQLKGSLQAGTTWRYRVATHRCKF